jgi:hypothetical protein
VFENRVLRRIFEYKRDEVPGGRENCIVRSFIIFTLYQIKENQMVGHVVCTEVMRNKSTF